MGSIDPAGGLRRRQALAGLAATSALIGAAAIPRPAAAAPVAAAFPDGATLLIAGPSGGPLEQWADWIEPPLRRALATAPALHRDLVGAADGVTGANQFAARTVPDGTTALLLPGSAALAWLVGDPRARFDVATWVPALAGITASVLVSRITLPQVMAGTPIRLAAAHPGEAQLPAMLALDGCGAAWRPVYGINPAGMREALASGAVDAVYLTGERLREQVQAAASLDAQPMLGFATVDEQGRMQRDPMFADLTLADDILIRTGNRPLLDAFRATRAASQLEMALVLPQQTPAAMVALWRRACLQAATAPDVMQQTASRGARPLAAPAATAFTTALTIDAATLLELRHWLATRLHYQLG